MNLKQIVILGCMGLTLMTGCKNEENSVPILETQFLGFVNYRYTEHNTTTIYIDNIPLGSLDIVAYYEGKRIEILRGDDGFQHYDDFYKKNIRRLYIDEEAIRGVK